MKTAQKKALLHLLEQHGWQRVSTEGREELWSSAEWFIAELWEIESVWSPRGFRAFITFVVDPLSHVPAENRWRKVWMVIASRRRPTTWGAGADEVGLMLSHGWQAGLPAFFHALNDMRMNADTHEQTKTLLA